MGIGTATPTANLEVNGTAKFDQPVTFAPDQSFTQNFILVSAAGSTGPSDILCPNHHPHVYKRRWLHKRRRFVYSRNQATTWPQWVASNLCDCQLPRVCLHTGICDLRKIAVCI